MMPSAIDGFDCLGPRPHQRFPANAKEPFAAPVQDRGGRPLSGGFESTFVCNRRNGSHCIRDWRTPQVIWRVKLMRPCGQCFIFVPSST